MYERFTDRARKVMQLANLEALRVNHEFIGTEHILLGLVKEGSGVAANVLKNLDIDLPKIRLEVEKIIQSGPSQGWVGILPQTPRAKKVIEYAIEEARNLNHNYVGTEHLLLGLVREGEGVAAQIFMNLGLTLEAVRGEVLQLLGFPIVTEESCSGRELVHRGSGSGARQEKTAGESCSGPTGSAVSLAVERERIRSLETQLWNLRVVLGAAAGAVAGALLSAEKEVVVVGLILGGIVAGLGGRILGVLAGGMTGFLLGSTHLPGQGGAVAGVLLGALAGVLIAETGGPSGCRARRK